VVSPFVLTVADRVRLRTVDACEPRQVRKEAAAAGYARVAVLSGSIGSFFTLIKIILQTFKEASFLSITS